VTSISSRRNLDVGRLVMVPAAILMLIVDVHVQVVGTTVAASSAGEVLRGFSAFLVCAFYALIVWCYLRRGPAVSTSRSVSASAVAVLATLTPFVFPLLGGDGQGTAGQLAADVLLVAGTSWSVWSLRFLGRNLSVIAQARGVADRGPYRLVRHPLYSGEIISSLGLAVAVGSAAAFAVWLALIAMQVYRAIREEQVLLQALPLYRDYRARTAALLPGVF
jgi:protein-S-isoprenylcysteine O-methyltransferase Ste14